MVIWTVISASRATLQSKGCNQKILEKLIQNSKVAKSVLRLQTVFAAAQMAFHTSVFEMGPEGAMSCCETQPKNSAPSVFPAWEMDPLCTSVPQVITAGKITTRSSTNTSISAIVVMSLAGIDKVMIWMGENQCLENTLYCRLKVGIRDPIGTLFDATERVVSRYKWIWFSRGNYASSWH